jgi:hypothetical protein
MAHSFHDAKGNGKKQQHKKGEPFDPEELTRRLTAHLAEQKLKAKLRQDARAAKAAAQQSLVYHHVPKVAALAFARTTTPDTTRQIHKLSQPVLKQHLEHLSLDDYGVHQTCLQRTQALDYATVERDMLRNRNQFQWNHDMKEAAEVDLDRGVYKLPQRSFDSEYAHLKKGHEEGAQRTLSTEDTFWEEDQSSAPVPLVTKTSSKPIFDGRNDWAQQEEIDGNIGRMGKEKASPFLRKRDSIWILKGRKDKSGKLEKDDPVSVVGNSQSPPDISKTGRGSFLARFKRRPS